MTECEICGYIHANSREALACEAEWEAQKEIDADCERWDRQIRAEQQRAAWMEDARDE